MRRKCSGRWLRSQRRLTSAGWSSSRLAVTLKMRSAPDVLREPGHLRGGAPVHEVVGARQRRPVSVDEDDGGQSRRDRDAADLRGCHARLGQDLPGQPAEGLPVARRVVLRPARAIRVDGVLLEGVAELLTLVAHEGDLGAAGAEVRPKQEAHGCEPPILWSIRPPGAGCLRAMGGISVLRLFPSYGTTPPPRRQGGRGRRRTRRVPGFDPPARMRPATPRVRRQPSFQLSHRSTRSTAASHWSMAVSRRRVGPRRGRAAPSPAPRPGGRCGAPAPRRGPGRP